ARPPRGWRSPAAAPPHPPPPHTAPADRPRPRPRHDVPTSEASPPTIGPYPRRRPFLGASPRDREPRPIPHPGPPPAAYPPAVMDSVRRLRDSAAPPAPPEIAPNASIHRGPL